MIAALSFLTIFGRGRVPKGHTMRWFPVAGAVIGAALGVLGWGASTWWTPGVAAALVIAADLAVTGMLHLDGLADSADGLLPHLDRDARLRVMRQPDTGAFGVGVMIVTLLLRFTALASMLPHRWRVIALLAGLWALSRTTMAVISMTVPYSRTEGLATAFLDDDRRATGTATLVALGGLSAGGVGAWLWVPSSGHRVAAAGVVVAVAAIGAASVVALAVRRIGGFTGDVLGASGMVAETVGLVAAAARW